MDYQSLHIKTVAELRRLAKDMKVRLAAGMTKENIIQTLLEAEAPAAPAPEAAEPKKSPRGRKPKAQPEGEAPAKRRGRKPKAQAEAGPVVKGRPGRKPKAAQAQTPGPSLAPAAPAAVQAEPSPAPSAPEAAQASQPAVVPAVEAAPAPQPTAPAEAPQEAPAVPAASSAPAPQGEAAPQPESAEPRRVGYLRRQPASPAPAEDTTAQRPFREAGQRSFARTTRPAAPGDARPSAPRQRFDSDRNPRPAGEGTRFQRASGERDFRRSASTPRGSYEPRYPVPRGEETAPAAQAPEGEAETRRPSAFTPEYGVTNPGVPELLAGGDCPDGAGVLEIHPDGYGFLRAENYSTGPRDVYISIAQIRRFNLRVGDYVVGKTRPQREGDRYNAIIFITEVNGRPPEEILRRRAFDTLVPIYPDQRLRLEEPQNPDLALRIVDMLAPIGKGQRGMIVSPPKAGKTTLLKKMANAIVHNNPEVHMIVLLIDERPEEVTDMKRSIQGEVVYSTFDETPENHARISEMVLERAQRLVEQGEDVVVLLDSITRLARAYNLTIPPTGRSLSGGLDPGALHKPKRFFGAARNIENGGSLTIIATALVETGSRMDDIIYEEFKGTGNMELHLDRKLSDRRIFPAIDMVRSGTRREELLMDETELEGSAQVRKLLSGGSSQDIAEQLIGMLDKTYSNADFYQRLKGWIAIYEKDGFTMGGSAPRRDLSPR